MKKIFNICMKIILIITLFSFAVILFDALVNNTYISEINYKLLYFGYFFISCILIFLFIVLFRKIDNMSDRKTKIFKYIIWCLIVLVEIILICNINVMQISDTFFIQNEALAIGKGEQDIVDYSYSSGYFSKVSNNNLLLFIFIVITKIFGTIGKEIIILNTLCINISIILTYAISKKVKDEKFAIKTLLLSALNPINYLYIFFVYSTTLSLPFLLGIVYIALLIKDRKTIYFAILFGLVFVLGFLLRPIEVIPLIALLLAYLYINGNNKNKLIVSSIIIISICSSYTLTNKLLKKYSPDNSKNLPVTHFIMMGLHENGEWNQKDIAYTMSYDTKREKIEANVNEIKRTLKEYGISGICKHFIDKCSITWADGTSNYEYRLQYVNDGSIFYNSIIGQKSHIMKIYCQSFRIVTCIFIIISIISQIRKKDLDWRNLFSLILFGAIIFYFIWEGKSIYSIPFIPFMLILMTNGLDIFTKKIDDILLERNIIWSLEIGIILFSVIILLSLKQELTDTQNIYKSYNLRIPHLENSLICENELEYSFNQSRKFNRIDNIFVKNIEDPELDKKYIFELYRNEELRMSSEFSNNDISEGILKISFEDEVPRGKEKYYIKIYNNDGSKKKLLFLCNTQKNQNLYDRYLIIDKNEYSYDLGINVYYEETNEYMSKKKFTILVASTIFLESIILVNLKKKYILK